MNLNKVYYDGEGNAKNILQMVKCGPEWAANRIQEGEKAIAEIAANGIKPLLSDVLAEIGKHEFFTGEGDFVVDMNDVREVLSKYFT
ncbi:MAG: hypothetical protein ACRCUT_14005 [Spirochaetota bacterium]